MGIICSPRLHGNTEILVQASLAKAQEAGAEVELVALAGKRISPCDSCGSCSETRQCHIKDDMQDIYAKLLDADGIIFGTPVYYWSVTAQAKALIDRTYVFRVNRDLRNKVVGVVVVQEVSGAVSAFIGRTFQIVRPFPRLTVTENVLVGVLNRIDGMQKAREKVAQVLEFVHLEKKSELSAEMLNIPELKRLELAKALATEPRLLMLDEVMAGLNSVEQDQMISLVQKIRGKGITILIIEHVMKTVMQLSDRIFVIHHGVEIAEGTPQEVSRNQKVIEAYLGEEV